MQTLYTFCELVALLTAIVLAPPTLDEKITHFTWWGIASLIIFDLTLLASPTWPIYYRSYYFAAATIACTIAVGVIGLSIMHCTLLTDAARDMGGPLYIVGNMAIHYYPVTRILCCRPPGPAKMHQGLLVASILMAYLHVQEASAVYGCTVSHVHTVTAAAAGVAIAALLTSGAERWYSHIFHRTPVIPRTAPARKKAAPRPGRSGMA